MSSSRYASLLRVLTNNPTSNISASGGEEDQLYLDYLCASSLQKLRLEPSVLEEEEKSVVGELTGLAYSEYDSFLATSNCGKEVRQLYADFEKHLEKLLQTSVPKFTQTAIEEFLRNGNQIL